MTPLWTAVAVVLVIAMGWSVLSLVAPGRHALSSIETIAVSWLLGAGYLAWLVHLSLLITGRVQPWLWEASLGVVAIALFRHRNGFSPRVGHMRIVAPRLTGAFAMNLLPLALLTWQAIYVLMDSFATGLRWDGLAVWALKAKALYLDSTTAPSSFLTYYQWIANAQDGTASAVRAVSNPAHPDGLPTLEAWFYHWIGHIDEHAIKVIGPLFFACTIIVVAQRLTQRISIFSALVLACLLASAPWVTALATTGYADVPLMAYCAGAAGFGAHYLQRANRQSAVLSVILGAMLILFKREGVILAALLTVSLLVSLALMGARTRAATFLVLSVLVGTVIGGPWLLLTALNGTPNLDMLPVSAATFMRNAHRIAETGKFALDLVTMRVSGDWGSMGLVWLAVAAVALARLRALIRPGPAAFLAMSCIACLAVDVLLFVFSAWDPYVDHVKRTLDRLILQITPVGVLMAGYLLASQSARLGVVMPQRRRQSTFATPGIRPQTANMLATVRLPSVAIIVLTWNGRDLTLDCLASLVSLTYANHAIFVVDNGSHDNTVDAIRRRFPSVTVIQNGDNLGFAEGNNAGIRHVLAAGFDYILLLNNDTVVDPHMLHELVNVGEADATVGVMGPVIYYHDAPDVIWSAGNAVDWRAVALRRLHADSRGADPTSLFEVDYVTGCALCIKREVVERIGLLDPRYFIYFEETDWCFRARAQGYRVVVAPRARIWHKVSATMQPDSPATTYYMSRNVFLFVHSHLAGFRRIGALARVALQQSRVVLAQTFRPRYAALRRNRDARVFAVRDALLGRWGKMGTDVAEVC